VTSIAGGGGTWAPVVTKTGTGTAATTWAAFNIAGGGSTTITITFSASGKGAASVAEFSGIAAASAVDATGSVTGGSTTAVSSGNATTTNATDLVVAAVGWRTGAAPTTSPGSPWTNLADQVNSSISNATSWQITSATGTYAAAWILGASTPGYDGTIAAFKRVAGGDTTPPSVPTGLGVSVATSKQLNLAWTASTDNVGVQGYRVYRDGSLAATVGTNAFSDTGLAGGSAHTYTVAALDGAGNASAQSTTAAGTATAPVRTTTYAYDLADRLTGITPTTGASATLTLDALGRHRTRGAAGITETYTYAGESSAIVRISPSTGTTTSSVVDATGARLAVSTSTGGFGWTLSDLHGDIAGYAAASGAVVTDATRYDPYGEVVATTSSGLGSPWGYQGRLDLAASTDTDLLDFGFRPYAPDLGTFTSPDDQAGSALNPLTFNRYLYAGANPETLVDPDGHWPWDNIQISVPDVIGTVASIGVAAGTAFVAGSIGLGAVAVGAVVGAAASVTADVVAGRGVHWESAVSGAAAGATFTGAFLLTKNVALAGAAAGAAGNLVSQGINWAQGNQRGINVGELAIATGAGAAFGVVGAKVGQFLGPRVSPILTGIRGRLGAAIDGLGGRLRAASTDGNRDQGGARRILRDGEGSSAPDIAASTGGPTGGSRLGQAQIRKQLLNAANGRYTCWRCGETTSNPSNIHLGHRNVAASRGGNVSPLNVCLEGAACNLGAGARGAPAAGRSCFERGSCGAPYGRRD